jgi:hypothetical protein
LNKQYIYIVCNEIGLVTDISASSLNYFDVEMSKILRGKSQISYFVKLRKKKKYINKKQFKKILNKQLFLSL